MLEMTGNQVTYVDGSDRHAVYDLVSSAADFTCYMDFGDEVYDEHYCHPDCVVQFPGEQQTVWFDLDHLTVGGTKESVIKRHAPWNLYRKKMAFIHPGVQVTSLVYPVLESQVLEVKQPRSLDPVQVRYVRSQPYEQLCQFTGDSSVSQEAAQRLQSAWETHRKMKIGTTFGNSVLIFPVRLAYREQGLWSFTSKTIVIPDVDATRFSWEQSSLGNICISSDGSCSILRYRKARGAIRHLLASCFPRAAMSASRLQDQGIDTWRARLRHMIRRSLIEPITPFTITQATRPMTVFAAQQPEEWHA